MYDVVIVGAGPAGATLARLVGRTHRVLLLDRRHLDKDGGPEKCCGGLLAPDAQVMLARLGLGVPRHVLVGPQLFTVRTIDWDNNRERYYQRHYINVDRELFDRWLVSLVPDTVHTQFAASFLRCNEHSQGFDVHYRQGGQEYCTTTRFLIGADGALSRVRRQLLPGPLPKLYVCLQDWYEIERPLPWFSAIFDREVTDFYSWTIPKENQLLVGSAIPGDWDAAARFSTLVAKLGKYGVELGEKQKTRSCWLYRPRGWGQLCAGAGNLGLIGEAAGWVSPSSAEGLSYGFRSALMAAGSLRLGGLADYRRRSVKLKLGLVTKNLKEPFMYNRLLRGMVLRSGLMGIDIETE